MDFIYPVVCSCYPRFCSFFVLVPPSFLKFFRYIKIGFYLQMPTVLTRGQRIIRFIVLISLQCLVFLGVCSSGECQSLNRTGKWMKGCEVVYVLCVLRDAACSFCYVVLPPLMDSRKWPVEWSLRDLSSSSGSSSGSSLNTVDQGAKSDEMPGLWVRRRWAER